MSFISAQFLAFFILVFTGSQVAGRFGPRIQNGWLLLAGIFFYGFWSWKFLLLFLAVAAANYLIGRAIGSNEGKGRRRAWLITGLILNIGNLVLFKYFNFFIEELTALLSVFGIILSKVTLTWIIPLGISFYTFISLSYLMDVYRKKTEAEKNPVDLVLALTFFPVILSGPVQRPSLLLPQLKQVRIFNGDETIAGLRQILWGLFTKLVIADNLAPLVNEVFADPAKADATTVPLAFIFFSIQVYADFSAYSDMAIGMARILGIRLVRNFAYPYFATNIAEFWQRWHMSLTSWFRDYLFLPVAYSLSARLKKERYAGIPTDYILYAGGISVTWFITGLWHGANTTFLVWGMIHGLFLILYQLQKKPRKTLLRKLEIRGDNRWISGMEATITLLVVMVSLVFFRADNLAGAQELFARLGDFSLARFPDVIAAQFLTILWVIVFFMVEWQARQDQFALETAGLTWPVLFRWSIYISLICAIFLFSRTSASGFLYFKF